MSLIKSKKRGMVISTPAQTCPPCKRPPRISTSGKMLVPIVVLLLAFGAIANAEDFTTRDGVKHSGEISRVEPDGIVLVSDSGIEKVPFINLPADIQKKFNYDPEKAAKYSAALIQSQSGAASRIEAAKAAIAQKTKELAGAAEQERKSAPKPDASSQPSAKPDATFSTTPESVVIKGVIVQRTSKGLLVSTKTRRGQIGNFAKGDFWLVGLDAREDAIIDGHAVIEGTYEYTTVTGAARVADCYRWISGTVK